MGGENVGSYAIEEGTLSLGSNYEITYVGTNLTVSPAGLTVSADNTNKVYGQTVTFTGNEFTVSGLVNGDSVTGVMLASVGATNSAGVGNYPILAGGAVGSGLGNYTIGYVNGTLDVGPAELGVRANDTNRLYGAGNPVFTASISGFVNGESLGNSDVVGGPSLGTLADTNSPVGGYEITNGVGSLASTNYTFSLTNGTLSVDAAAITVSADDQSRGYGAANPVLTASYTGFVNGDSAGVIEGAPVLSVVAGTNAGVGIYVISNGVGSLSATNYEFMALNGTLTVTQASLTLTASNASKVYGQTLSFAGTEFGAVGLENGETVGSVTLSASGGTNAGDGAGSYVITPSGATGGSFNAANYAIGYVTGTLTVSALGVSVRSGRADEGVWEWRSCADV